MANRLRYNPVTGQLEVEKRPSSTSPRPPVSGGNTSTPVELPPEIRLPALFKLNNLSYTFGGFAFWVAGIGGAVYAYVHIYHNDAANIIRELHLLPGAVGMIIVTFLAGIIGWMLIGALFVLFFRLLTIIYRLLRVFLQLAFWLAVIGLQIFTVHELMLRLSPPS